MATRSNSPGICGRVNCRRGGRRGAASLDYVLTIALMFPVVGFFIWAVPRMLNLVYSMTAVLVSWPFM